MAWGPLSGSSSQVIVSGESTPESIIASQAYAHWLFDDPNYLWQNTAKTTAVTADDDPVQVVSDRIGSNDLVAPSEGTRFAFKTTELNGHNVCRADGTDDYMVSGAFSFSGQPYYLLAIYKFNTLGLNDILFDGLGSGYDTAISIHTDGVQYYAGAGPLYSGSQDWDLAPHAGQWYLNGAGSSMEIDGVTVTGDAGTLASSTGLRLASRYDGGQDADIDYLEVMLLRSTISTDDLSTVFAYLREKAGTD